MKNKAIKYRLYPDKKQIEFFLKTFGCCRKVWNLMLSDKIAYRNLSGNNFTFTPAYYKELYPFLKEVDSLALANVQLHLQIAYNNFFRGLNKKAKKRSGFPKYKSKKHARKSYTTNNQGGTISLSDNSVKLPKIGEIKAKIHRKPLDDWKIKSATVSMESEGNFYVSVLFEYEDVPCSYTVDPDKAIGLDYSSEHLYIDSNGNIGTNHKYYRESHRKLVKEQRKLARKRGFRKGETPSKNYLKQKLKVSKIHKHIAKQRLDNLHKTSTEIANQYDIVCVEDLNMTSLSNKGFGNGRATMDNGYGMFLNMLSYKLSDHGKYLVKVDKWYPSSQICSCCGYRNPLLKDLKVRKWECPVCHVLHGRDKNAAINIRNEGLRLLNEAS